MNGVIYCFPASGKVRLSLLSIFPQIINSTIGPFIATLLPKEKGDRNHSFSPDL